MLTATQYFVVFASCHFPPKFCLQLEDIIMFFAFFIGAEACVLGFKCEVLVMVSKIDNIKIDVCQHLTYMSTVKFLFF
jgi:hypothetical protein